MSYDLPKPGGVIIDNKLFANTVFPGLDIKYTLDGSFQKNQAKTYESPLEIQDSDIINLRLFDKKVGVVMQF